MRSLTLTKKFFSDSRIDYLASISNESIVTTRGRVVTLMAASRSKADGVFAQGEINLIAGWFHPSYDYADLMVAAGLSEACEDGFKLTEETPSVASPSPGLPVPSRSNKRATQTGRDLVVQSDEKQLPDAPKKKRGKQIDPELAAKARRFLAAYCDAYKARYSVNPDLSDPIMRGKVLKWLEGTGEDRAIQLVQVYCQIDYRYFNDRYHDLHTFLYNLSRISHALATGQNGDAIDWGKVFG